MIKVLHVFGCLDRGGAETMIMNYYRNIDRNKIQFDFISHLKKMGSYEEEINSLGGKIYRIPRFKGYNIISYIYEWNKLLKNHKEWDIIHIHIFTIAGIILPIAKRHGIKVRITHSHNVFRNFSLMKNMVNFLFKKLANKYSTHFFACGKDAGKYYFGENDFQIIRNAIDVSKFAFDENIRILKRKEFNCENKFVIGHVGAFTRQKNHSFLIDIFASIYRKNKNAILLLVGEGDLKSQIEQKVHELGLENHVIFTGVRTDISELLQAMDVFLFPSIYEGLSVVTIEAQSAGLPVFMSESLSDEMIITSLVQKKSLSRDANEWADLILKYEYTQDRKFMHNYISSAGFDIYDNVILLEKYYTNLRNTME